VWPNRARPRLLVLELESSEALSDLAHACETHARKAGFAPETRGFRAHITLARLRPGCAFGILPHPPPSIAFDAVALMQSTLAQPAATYTELARAELDRM
jgi:2'-5' RNA ligase